MPPPGYAYEGYVMVTWPTLPTNRRDKRDNSHSPVYDFRACEMLAHCANAKNIECEAMWLFLENTHMVHPRTPHLGGTPLENSRTPWGVRCTWLTSTVLNSHSVRHCISLRRKFHKQQNAQHTFAVHYKHLLPALQLLVNFKLFSYYLIHMRNIRGLLLLD